MCAAGVGTAASGSGTAGGCGAGGADSNETPLSGNGVKSARELHAGAADSSNFKCLVVSMVPLELSTL